MKTNKKAVSMVEVMIGVLLLALILIPSLNVIVGQTQTVTSTRDHAQAAFIADKILETARSYPFNMLAEESQEKDNDKKKKTFEYRLRNEKEYNTFESNGITYEIDTDPKNTSIDFINIKNASKDAIPNICAFKFLLKYVGKDGKNHQLFIQTILSQR